MLLNIRNAKSGKETLKQNGNGSVRQNPAGDSGLITGTLVETSTGWKCVELVRAGDMVQTYDGGLRQVKQVQHSYYGVAHGGFEIDQLVHIPGGALGNCQAMVMMPDQHLMLQSQLLDDFCGVPNALLPAAAFVGYQGIGTVSPQNVIETVSMQFEEEELVYANSGMLAHCPVSAGSDFFTVLDVIRAKALLKLMKCEPDLLNRAIDRINRDDSKLWAA